MKESTASSNHRTIGQKLDLFSINEEIGIGLVLWYPKGTTIRNLLRNYWEKEHIKNGYQLVHTPHIARGELWKTSGHLDYYSENMYVFEKDGESYVVKPMNCPFHIQIYKSHPRSYRELPIRLAEWGTVYRYERSGTLLGLLRVRGYTCDDAHIFCTSDQLEEEILKVLKLTNTMLMKLGFPEYSVELSTRDPSAPEKFMGSNNDWKEAQKSLAEALKKKNISYEEMTGEAAFYGPKIDIQVVDSFGRKRQCSTIQLDFNLPNCFNLSYIGSDGEEYKPLMIHRAILGSFERFLGVLLEHNNGNLPTWLAPVQVKVLPISENYNKYARQVSDNLSSLGVRSELDESSSTISYKIREAETKKIPYMAICGKKEEESDTISLRKHGRKDLGLVSIMEFVNIIKIENG